MATSAIGCLLRRGVAAIRSAALSREGVIMLILVVLPLTLVVWSRHDTTRALVAGVLLYSFLLFPKAVSFLIRGERS